MRYGQTSWMQHHALVSQYLMYTPNISWAPGMRYGQTSWMLHHALVSQYLIICSMSTELGENPSEIDIITQKPRADAAASYYINCFVLLFRMNSHKWNGVRERTRHNYVTYPKRMPQIFLKWPPGRSSLPTTEWDEVALGPHPRAQTGNILYSVLSNMIDRGLGYRRYMCATAAVCNVCFCSNHCIIELMYAWLIRLGWPVMALETSTRLN